MVETELYRPKGQFTNSEIPTRDISAGIEHVLTDAEFTFKLVSINGAGPLPQKVDGFRETIVVKDGSIDVMLTENGTTRTERLVKDDGVYVPAEAVREIRAVNGESTLIVAASAPMTVNPAYKGNFGTWTPEQYFFSLEKEGRFPQVYHIDKPWGGEDWLTVLSDGHVLKRISMNAGFRCSYQKHFFKLETNYLIEGEARLLLEDEHGIDQTTIIKPGEGWYVPVPRRHRVFADKPYVAFEVSTPEVDDIERMADDSGRGDGRVTTEHKK
ncbi:hypothetical protein GOV10_04335 [Candidatus Woesearchaeota archaeon]|nr:hypothetical protein [Candidatus Woesearchaeota archaeon]